MKFGGSSVNAQMGWGAHRASMQQVEVEGGGYYWDNLIHALGGDPDKSEMLCWGKVGHVLRRIVPHGQENADPENDNELHVCPFTSVKLHIAISCPVMRRYAHAVDI